METLCQGEELAIEYIVQKYDLHREYLLLQDFFDSNFGAQ